MFTTIEITLTGVVSIGGLVWALVQSKMNTKMKDLDDAKEKKILLEVNDKIHTTDELIQNKVKSHYVEMMELKGDFKEHKDKTETKFDSLLEGITESNRQQTAILGDIRTDLEVLKNKSER